MLPKTKQELARVIDHTILKPEATIQQIKKEINNTKNYGFRSIVIPPWALEQLDDEAKRQVTITTVISFPHGTEPIRIKKQQILQAQENGAKEVDVVISIWAIKSGKWNVIETESKELTTIAHDHGMKIKYILETGLLTTEEIIKTGQILVSNKADFLKTSTGYGPRGAMPEDIILLKSITKEGTGIKASGGIRTAIQALLFLQLGADVIGTSSGTKIIEGFSTDLLRYFGE